MKTQIIGKEHIDFAVDALNKGESIAFKTDTIFGLSCLATDKNACQKLLQTKGREGKPLIILLGKNMKLKNYVKNIPQKIEKIISHFWPGPLTVIFELNYPFCNEITCGKSTIAIRVPNHELTQQILEKLGAPIVSTSANMTGEKPLNSEDQIFSVFNGKIPYIIKCEEEKKSTSSTIISFSDNNIHVLREGSIKSQEFKNF